MPQTSNISWIWLLFLTLFSLQLCFFSLNYVFFLGFGNFLKENSNFKFYFFI